MKIGIKDRNGKYKNYMVSVSDEVDQYGNNVAMYVEQTKEEREAKVKRQYVGNGRVIWTDGKIETAPNPNAPKNVGVDIGSEPEQESKAESVKAATAEVPLSSNEQPQPQDYEPQNALTDGQDDDLPF